MFPVRFVNSSPSSSARARVMSRLRAAAVLCALAATVGCSHFRPHPDAQYVYVIAKQSVLRDRVAAVSNRTGEVTNGEKLQVLARDRRFVKVRTPNGTEGWLEARLTADQGIADQFEALHTAHLKDPVVASASARDDVYLHISPGRETDRFFRLSEGDPINLLKRATVPKPPAPGAAPVAQPKMAPVVDRVKGTATIAPAAPPEPVMEDWWLVRGAQGQTGWVYSRLIDVNIPDAVARYAEGQRIVGAYVLNMVNDPDSGVLNNGQPVTEIPEYLTVVGSYKAGLPYDFDQVRVFIWNVKKHRYETSFRERNIEGYLPVALFKSKDPYGKGPEAALELPAFSYKVLSADAPPPQPNPSTGVVTPGKTITKTYRLEGNLCRRLLPPGTPPPTEAHPAPEPEKEKKGRHRRR
ncbi:MAG TPA: SH3 domain-containing protein [Acidobacteriaceae bacterium]|nr:SH3 domain-containing protein [Acidobacteriaceae bacterium]